MNPPDRAVALSIDGKTRTQALARTRKGLPMKPGRPATMTRDCKRHGATNLFAALNILDGKAVGRHAERRRSREFIEFLDQVDNAAPAGPAIHAILDNCATRKHGAVGEWLADHPRWTFHFTPAPCSWMNAVEGFFGKLASRRPRRGAHDSVEELEKSITDFIELHNGKEATACNWTASPERPVAARQRGYHLSESCH